MTKDIHIFKTIFEQSPVSTQVFTPDGKTLMVNKAWGKLWHVPFKYVKSYNVLKDKQLVERGTMPYIIRGFKGEVVSMPAIKYDPSKNVSLKGIVSHRWLSAIMYPIKDSKGKITHLVLQHEDITERKNVEDALTESEARFRTLTNHAPVGIFLTDKAGNCLFVNKRWTDMAGISKKAAMGQGWMKALHPEDRDLVFSEWYKSAEAGREFKMEYRFRTPKGKVIWLSGSSVALRAHDDSITGYMGTITDITALKKAELALSQSEERYRVVAENSHDLINLLDLKGNFLYVNPSHKKILGYSPRELVGQNAFERMHPDDVAGAVSEFKKSIKSGFGQAKLRYLHKKGHYINLEGTGARVLNEKKEPVMVVAIFRDISERKKAEDAVKMSEERLRIALNAGNIGVWDWDIIKNEIMWTDNVYKIHGVSKNSFEVNFENFSKLIHPEDGKRFTSAIENSLKNRKTFNLDFRILTPGGETRWVTTRAATFYDRNGAPVRLLGATSDITKQKQIEQEKSDFLSMASHELKTPLTSMKIFIELLRKVVEGQKPKYYVKRIKDQSDRLSDLISDLLDVSRIETGKLRLDKNTFSLRELIADTIEGIQPSTNKHKIMFSGKSDVLVNADRYRIYQVLVNLLTNAIKYSRDNQNIRISLQHNRNKVVVSVKDAGIGISKKQQIRVFERLYQVNDTKEKTYPGLGLGLYISKEIIERHSGKIWVESKKGKGSTFYFSIPREYASPRN